MSLFDRVTKAVGDAVDKGKKEVDQFMRIQKINGLVGESETKIAGFKEQIQQTKVQIGEKAVEMLKAGALASPDLQAFLDRLKGFEEQIAGQEAAIAGHRAEIEKIKAEEEAIKPAAPADAPKAAEPAAPEVPPATRVCPQCGAQAGTAAFCSQCGTKLG
jgi:wobble nucleotide-excising tRNase